MTFFTLHKMYRIFSLCTKGKIVHKELLQLYKQTNEQN